MPYTWQTKKIPMPREHDRRVKLTDEDREEIKRLYGTISQRKLAAMFGVSRRLIIFIACPEKHAKNLRDRAARGGSHQYYDKEYNTTKQREHRQYKTKVLKEIKEEENNGKIDRNRHKDH